MISVPRLVPQSAAAGAAARSAREAARVVVREGAFTVPGERRPFSTIVELDSSGHLRKLLANGRHGAERLDPPRPGASGRAHCGARLAPALPAHEAGVVAAGTRAGLRRGHRSPGRRPGRPRPARAARAARRVQRTDAPGAEDVLPVHPDRRDFRFDALLLLARDRWPRPRGGALPA